MRRRAKARARGEIPSSPLANGAACILASGALSLAASFAVGRWAALLRESVRGAARSCAHEACRLLPALPQPHAASLIGALTGLVCASWLVAIAGGVAGVAACGLAVSTQALRPRWAALSPAGAWRRIAVQDGLAHAALAGAAIVIVAAAYAPLVQPLQRLSTVQGLSVAVFAGAGSLKRLWLWASCGMALLAVADVLVRRRRATLQLRMTRREVRDERNEFEGRPEIKARRKAVAAKRSKTSRLAAIRRATAVVTNPAHLAVALRYEPPAIDVPLVVVRAAGMAAALVRNLAELHDVPVVRSPELARMLWRRVDVDESIPEDCYAAVAALFAWLLRTRGRL